MTQQAADRILTTITELLTEKPRLLVAIDGRCASGKTTLAAHLQSRWNCSVIHMDHFFPQLHQRTPERLQIPGGNVDRERFLQEVLIPWKQGQPFSYRPYNCQTHRFDEAVPVEQTPITIIEGSYSCHPELREYYDLAVFLTVNPEIQMQRILHRNGPEVAVQFRERWIPLEERYFAAYPIAASCDLQFDMETQQ